MPTRRTPRVRTRRSTSAQAEPAPPAAGTLPVPRVSGRPKAAKASQVASKRKGKQPAAEQAAHDAVERLITPDRRIPRIPRVTHRSSSAQAGPAAPAARTPPVPILTRRDSVEVVRKGEPPDVQLERPVPSEVGEFEEQVPYIDPAAEQAAHDAVERWITTFTPDIGPPPPPTEDPKSLQNQLNYAVLELQADAIANGNVPPPPPLSTEGLALKQFYKLGEGRYDLTTTLRVQQEILEIIGKERQKLVETAARRLLFIERCIAGNFAFQAFGITENIRGMLTDLLVSGSLPSQAMDMLANFIQAGGGYDLIMNPMNWLVSTLGSLVTQGAVNTYIAIWLTNQLIGAQMFAQMAGDTKLNDKINTTSEELLRELENGTFFDQIESISYHIQTLFNESIANIIAIMSTGFNLPEIVINHLVTAGEERLVAFAEVPRTIVARAARDVREGVQRERERRSMARDVAIEYRDAPEVARLAVQPAPTGPGLSELGGQILNELARATGQLIRSALVLFGIERSRPTDVIIKINNRIADTLVGSYLGYIQQLGYAIGEMPETAPVRPPTRPDKIPSVQIVDKFASMKPKERVEEIAGLIDARVNQMDTDIPIDMPCPRRRSLSDMPYSPESPAAAAAAAAPADDEEEEETQPLDPESQETFFSADSAPAEGGARKRKHHSTRSSTSSKSSKSGTRKHGKAISKRVKKGGAKTRHVRLPHGAGRRTRKHSKRGRK